MMSKAAGKEGGLSMRGGAIVLKTISIFLSNGRNAKSAAAHSAKQAKKKAKRMAEKDNKNKIALKLAETLKRDTKFIRSEIESLYKVYRKLVSMNKLRPNLDKTSGAGGASIIRKPSAIQEGINRTVFCELLHNTFDIVTEDVLMDRIFCVWDKDNAGLLTPYAWFMGLSVFLRGNFSEQIEFCFAVYDLNSDGFITKDEMFQLLKNCLIKQPQDEDPDEGVRDLVEIVLRKLDKDKDGKVSLEDFKDTVNQEPLLLEAFGMCLPSETAKDTFLATLKV